jgi:hypothetical protein
MAEIHKDVMKLENFFTPTETSEEHQNWGPMTRDDSKPHYIGL